MGKRLDIIVHTNGSHWRILGTRGTLHEHIFKDQFDYPMENKLEGIVRVKGETYHEAIAVF